MSLFNVFCYDGLVFETPVATRSIPATRGHRGPVRIILSGHSFSNTGDGPRRRFDWDLLYVLSSATAFHRTLTVLLC